jgi:putative spermidine/putrescine transport system ATP-binding protein
MSHEIQLIDLAKTYHDETPALAGVNLTCPRSRTTTLLGPSGSGKSTILKIVAGLLRPTGGTVLFEGRDVTWLPPERRNIGMVFQHYALFPNMTVRENVEFGLLVRGVPSAERATRANHALEIVQISALGHRRIHQLSGGQQQRVALARAVVFQPDILLLDEPLSALDAKIRHELRSELARLLREFKITAVYVTHDQQEAMSLGDQVVVMDKGKIMQAGAPLEVYTRPANGFVANFIGTANLYDVDVEVPRDGKVVVRAAFGELAISQERFAAQWPAIGAGPARLVCRPQDVMPSDPDGATTRLKVDERLFLGDRLRVSGVLPGGARMQIEVANTLPVSDGESLPLRIDPERLHFIAPEARAV